MMKSLFKNRDEAAVRLAEKLEEYKGKEGVVLAVPRGGAPLGYIIARELDFPLEVALSKKIGHPNNPEYAIGSVSLHGTLVNEGVTAEVGTEYINREAERILNALKEKYKMLVGDRKPVDLKNKTVIIVDDGVATGSTIKATVHSVRQSNPKEIIIAVPVAPKEASRMLAGIADELVCLYTPEPFYGVGQFYEDFSQVSDEEVVQLLKGADAGAKQKPV